MNNDLFFQALYEKIQTEEGKHLLWKQDPRVQSEYAETLGEAITCLDETKCFLKDAKVYIILRGTVSAGKSTFINSLLGQQLLPSKNAECTKKFLFIKYGEKLLINGQEFDNLQKANEKLTVLQTKESQSVQIVTPSLFHKELQCDLRERVILVDTPGFITGETSSINLFEVPDCVQSIDQIIQLFLCDYTAYADQKNKICSQINESPKLQQQDQQIQKYVPQKQFNLFWFAMNKFDRNLESEGDQIIDFINELNRDDVVFFKISAQNALRYRIMTLGDQMAQQEFIRKYYIDYKKECRLRDEKDCKEHCVRYYKDYEDLVKDKNQEYSELISQLVNEIKLKIINSFQCKLAQLQSYDYFFQIAINFKLQITKPLSSNKSIRKELRNLFHSFQNEVEVLTNGIKKIIQKSISECVNQIVTLKNIIVTPESEGPHQKICLSIFQAIQDYHKRIYQKNSRYYDQILENFVQIQIPNEQKSIILHTCNRMFEKYSDSQMECIKMYNLINYSQTEKRIEQCYKDILNIEFKKISQAESRIFRSSFFNRISFQKIGTIGAITVPELAVVAVLALSINYVKEKKNIQEKLDVYKTSNIKELQTELYKIIDSTSQQYLKTQSNLKKYLQKLTQDLE